jgi:hypothetical protein
MEIYKITNTKNNKIYIGKTKNNIKIRWRWHINSSRNIKNQTHISRTIRKYGVDKFKIEKIDEANSLEELKTKEFKWIAFYDSTNKKIGYNIQSGDENDNLLVHEDTKIKLVKVNKQNKLNGFSKRNSSEMKTIYVGVYYIKSKKLWAYCIAFKGKRICKKRYETDYDAAIGRDIKLLELFDKEKAIEMMNFPENYEKYVSREIIEKERERKIKQKLSNYLGVQFEENVKRWSATIIHKKKRYKKGTFIEEKDAAEMADYIRVSNEIEGKLNFPEINYSDSNYIPPKTEDDKQKSKRKYPDYMFEEKTRNGKIIYRIRCKPKNIDKYFGNLDLALEYHKKTII